MSDQKDLFEQIYRDIRDAKKRIRKAHANGERAIVKTPVKRSYAFAEASGAAEVWLKLESFQRTGSYKERGALNLLRKAKKANPELTQVVAASAGNHAQGVAHHATQLGLKARIFMPTNTPSVKIARTRMFGGEVILRGDNFDEARAAMLREMLEGELFVPPFDHPDIIAGQGTVALEFLDKVEDLDVLILPVGGGGLIAGMAVAAKAIKPDIRIFGVEPAVLDSWRQRRKGVNESKPLGGSIAEGIYVKSVGDLTFTLADPLIEDVIAVTEPWMEQAIYRFAEHERLVVEGAGAAGLAALLYCGERFRGQRVGLVVSGGNIDLRLFASVMTRAMVRDGRLVVLHIECEDQPGQLAKITRIIGDRGGNIIAIGHHRSITSRPAKNAEVEVEIEVESEDHRADIEAALHREGFEVTVTSGHLDN